MPRTRVRLNLAAFRKLRTSDRAHEIVNDVAEKIADASGPGFEAHQAPSRNRARATVAAETPQAMADNARDLTLLRNLDAGRS